MTNTPEREIEALDRQRRFAWAKYYEVLRATPGLGTSVDPDGVTWTEVELTQDVSVSWRVGDDGRMVVVVNGDACVALCGESYSQLEHRKGGGTLISVTSPFLDIDVMCGMSLAVGVLSEHRNVQVSYIDSLRPLEAEGI